MGQKFEMVEPFAVPDTFVSGLGEVEDMGNGLLRFSFFAIEHGQCVLVAKLVAPKGAVPSAVVMATKAAGACACETVAGMTVN